MEYNISIYERLVRKPLDIFEKGVINEFNNYIEVVRNFFQKSPEDLIERDFQKIEEALEKAVKQSIPKNPVKAHGLLVDVMNKRHSFDKRHRNNLLYQAYEQRINLTIDSLAKKYNRGKKR
ncbi:hypothetical protein GOV13_01475 [Candidatus Pacearchaeota archaeon]|nr:hypothetical protein [Candidatus Pacearchaeota archaeon]